MKILIAYDGSESAEAALNGLAYAGLPKIGQARILNAIPPLMPMEFLAASGEGVAWYGSAYKEAVENEKFTATHAQSQVKDAAKTLKKLFPHWKIDTKTMVDDPAHAILSFSEKWKPNLIVMGSRGWNTFSELLLGSVAERVLSHAHCSVRLGKGEGNGKPHAPRLLLAYDGSKYADGALAQIATRTWPKGTKVWILAISDFQLRMNEISLALNRVATDKKGSKIPESWIEKKMAKAAEKLESMGISAETALMSGEPRHTLLLQSKKLNVDTIFIGSRGTSGLERFFLGSTSSAVAAHATCSVEIIRFPERRPKVVKSKTR